MTEWDGLERRRLDPEALEAELANIRQTIHEAERRSRAVQRLGFGTLFAIFFVTVAALGLTIYLAAQAQEASQANGVIIERLHDQNAGLGDQSDQISREIGDVIAGLNVNREILNQLAEREGVPQRTAPPRSTPAPRRATPRPNARPTPRATPRPAPPATRAPSTPAPTPAPTPCPLPICLP